MAHIGSQLSDLTVCSGLDEPGRPHSEPNAAGKKDRGSARFSLTAFATDKSQLLTKTVAPLPAGPVGVRFAEDKWPPTITAVADASLDDRLKVGDVVSCLSVRHGDRNVDTVCDDLTGDQLEIILAADDGSPRRLLHVIPKTPRRAAGSMVIEATNPLG